MRIFESFGFTVASQRGSHIKLRRVVAGSTQTLIVPNHSQLDTGTLSGIVRRASSYVPEDELTQHFYA